MIESYDLQSASDEPKFEELIRQQHVVGGVFRRILFKIIEKSLRHFDEYFLLSQSDDKLPHKKTLLGRLNPTILFC